MTSLFFDQINLVSASVEKSFGFYILLSKQKNDIAKFNQKQIGSNCLLGYVIYVWTIGDYIWW